MPSSFAVTTPFTEGDAKRVKKNLDTLSKDLDKLDASSEIHKRKIKDLINDLEDIRTRLDNLMNLLGFDD